jgi:ribosomal RNA-processing protein 12
MADEIPASMLDEILSTLLVFLSSANREIVKSTLGFIKLAVHTLSEDVLRPQLPQLVPALLGWAHDHKNHFKAKVRHIFERMIRRFGFQAVHSCANGEAAKVLVNIKKRKDRAKRKKAAADGDVSDEVSVLVLFVKRAFIIKPHANRSSQRGPLRAIRLKTCCIAVIVNWVTTTRTTGRLLRRPESPRVETLHPVYESTTTSLWICFPERRLASRVCSTFRSPLSTRPPFASTDAKGNKRLKNRRDPGHVKTDEAGKMIFDESDSDTNDGAAEEDVAGTAYREALTSADGFTRGPGGHIKFNKDTKKRRRENAAEDEDVEMGEVESAKPGKKQSGGKIGQEFRAKVRMKSSSFLGETPIVVTASTEGRRRSQKERRA